MVISDDDLATLTPLEDGQFSIWVKVSQLTARAQDTGPKKCWSRLSSGSFTDPWFHKLHIEHVIFKNSSNKIRELKLLENSAFSFLEKKWLSVHYYEIWSGLGVFILRTRHSKAQQLQFMPGNSRIWQKTWKVSPWFLEHLIKIFKILEDTEMSPENYTV